MWTWRYILLFTLVAAAPVVFYVVLGWTWLSVPWLPIALVGTAVAFLISFKNNVSYDRLWEARKIYGGIINSSRAWAVMIRDFITNEFAEKNYSAEELRAIHQRMIYRHLGWLTALRHQLRTPRAWESTHTVRADIEYSRLIDIHERDGDMDEDLARLLSDADHAQVTSKSNTAVHILNLQSQELKELRELGLIDDFRHMEMQSMMTDFYNSQGKAERIKNFPYPRQYATMNQIFVWLFILLLPFGLLPEFAKLGHKLVWLVIPFTVLVAWVFYLMERIGEATENPFQGGANDVPITALSRTIEIDLRELLGESDIPEALTPKNHILS